MSYPRLAARLYNTPLLLEPGKAAIIERVFRAYAEGKVPEPPTPEAKKDAPSRGRQRNGYEVTDGGVAILPVHGTLVQRTGGMDAMSGLLGYDRIAASLEAALADAEVDGIVMEFDSPGGEVAGLFELADRMLATTKPIYAHANEVAHSAAYALACSAEELYVAPTGLVGSIGVIMMHVDQSQLDANRGLVYTPIFAGARKDDFDPHAPLSDEARDIGQAEIDRLYAIFVNHVANARPMSAAAVRDTEAGVYPPADAQRVGLADGIATLAETVQRMQVRLANEITEYSRPTRATTERSSTMDTKDKGAPGSQAATEQQIAEAEARGRAAAAADNAKAIADAQTAAATAAQARISGILSHAEATGRRAQAEHLAFKTAMTIDEAAAILATAQKETVAAAAPTNLLAAEMAKIPNPKVGIEGTEGEETEAQYGARIAAWASRAKLKAVKQ